jgi:MFS family permease
MRWPRFALAVLCTAQFVDVLDGNAVLVALPSLGRDLRLAGGGLQWVITAYVLVFGGCLLPAGRLADALGRRRVFAAGIALFTAASAACGAAPGAAVLIPARALQGLGAALTAPAALAMIVDAFPAGRPRERAVAAWTAVAALGGAAGVACGGVIAGTLGWRWVFLINLPVGAAALGLSPRVLPGRRGAGGFAPWPLVPGCILRLRPMVVAVGVAVALTATTSGGAVLATLHLQDALGLTPQSASLALLPLSLSVVAGSVLASRVRAPAPAVIVGGVLLVGAGSLTAAGGPGEAAIASWDVLAGLGLGAASVAATTLGASAVPEADRGAASALLNAAAQIGTAVGVPGLVLLAGATDHRTGFAAAAALALLAAALARQGTAPLSNSMPASSAATSTGSRPPSAEPAPDRVS